MNRNSRGRTAASTGASVGKLGAVATGGMTGISSANSGRKVPGSDDGYRGPQGDPGGDGFHASGRGNPVFRREDSVYGGPRRPGVLSGLGSTFSQFSSGVNLVLDDKRPSSLSLPFGVGGVVDADSTGDSPSSGRGGSGTGLDPLYFLLLLFLGHDKAYIASSLRDIAYGRAEQYSIEKAGGVSDVAAIGAIRHFLWGYYMAKKFGSAVLSILCDVLRETFTVALIPSKQQDSLADLHNTALGATYGTSDAEAAGESPEEIAFRLLQDGELYSNGADQTPKAAQVAVPSDAFLSRGCLRPFFYTNARMPGSFGDGSALDELSRRENSISKMLEERIQRQRDKR